MSEQFDRRRLAVYQDDRDRACWPTSNLKNALERQRILFNTVVDQLKQAKLAGDFSGTWSEIVEEANALPKAVRPLGSLALCMALAAGLLVGACLALVSDLLDPRVRSLGERAGRGDLSVRGQIPQLSGALEGQGQGRRSPSSATRAPSSPTAEAYQVARASLDLRPPRSPDDDRVILVTRAPAGREARDGPSRQQPRDLPGREAGRRVLLVDADLRRPTQHKIHGLQRDRGLVHVLRDLLTAHRVVQATAIKNLDLIASGPRATNPVGSSPSPFLHKFLDQVREATYDAVIIDALRRSWRSRTSIDRGRGGRHPARGPHLGAPTRRRGGSGSAGDPQGASGRRSSASWSANVGRNSSARPGLRREKGSARG